MTISANLKSAVRTISKYKTFSFLNVVGLGLGFAACLVIFLIVKYQFGSDKFNTKADRIFRVTKGPDFNANTSFAVAPALRNAFPQLEAVSQVFYQEKGLVKVNDQRYNETKYAFADQYFPLLFDYHWLEGNNQAALKEPNSIVLTASTARKYFGRSEAMGKTVTLDNQHNLIVTGVIEDLPDNTHLPFDFLVSFETIRPGLQQDGAMSNYYWINGGGYSYLLLRPGETVANLQQKMPAFIEKTWGKDLAKETSLILQPLTDIVFDTRYINNLKAPSSKEGYYALITIGVLILVVASINFVNLSTAQAITRAKEIGIRKVLGSSRLRLIRQFLTETAVIVGISMILSFIVVACVLPALSTSLDIRLSGSQFITTSAIFIISMVGIAIVFLAGIYPAMVQSAFNTLQALKTKPLAAGKRFNVRKILVVLQFGISQCMIAGTLVVAYQVDFLKNNDLGFDKEAIISIPVPDNKNAEFLRAAIGGIASVKNVSLSSGAPAYSNDFTSFKAPRSGMAQEEVTEVKLVDEQYLSLFRLKLLAGVNLTRKVSEPTDTVYNVLINKTMMRRLGITDPQESLGKEIVFYGNFHGIVAGVTDDFQSGSRHTKITPCILVYRPANFNTICVKLDGSNVLKTISEISRAWSGLNTEQLFSYEFLDEHIAAFYRSEQKQYTAFRLFSIIAIVIGCLGLYGLIAFASAQRTKEIGVRRILGASITSIMLLFSREFVTLILIALVIAIPVSSFLMQRWLQNFAYQIDVGVDIFIATALSSFFIAGCTIFYQCLKVANTNPVKSLKA